MHRKLLEISNIVDQASAELLRAYDPEQLYAFRVAARRIRSILKHIGSHRARRFRKSWGGFTTITSDARDWDVFMVTAEKLLPVLEYETFKALNIERVQSCHAAVIEMLQSTHWRRHMEEWVHTLERSTEDGTGTEQDSGALVKAMAKAQEMLERAVAVNDDRSWHKFRIAVKEVRYLADAGRGNPANENRGQVQNLKKISKTCKRLQTILGDWHDTVVQLNMLEELDAAPVHDRLSEIIQQRKQQFLAKIRKTLEEHPLFNTTPSASR